MAKILCVEDANDSIAILELTLQDYNVTFSRTMADAMQAISRSEFDLVLLDIELPDGSGFDFMAKFHGAKRNTPVIFLTGKKDFGSKASAFSLGAEDYIVKPFDPPELRLRVDAKIRMSQRNSHEQRHLRLGNIICHLDEHRVENRLSGKSIDLTSLEFRILVLLASTPNKVFTRSEILDRAWGDSVSVTERAVDVHVSNLRKKFAGTGTTIDGVIGSGYRILVTP